jgi:hypothetical protein
MKRLRSNRLRREIPASRWPAAARGHRWPSGTGPPSPDALSLLASRAATPAASSTLRQVAPRQAGPFQAPDCATRRPGNQRTHDALTEPHRQHTLIGYRPAPTDAAAARWRTRSTCPEWLSRSCCTSCEPRITPDWGGSARYRPPEWPHADQSVLGVAGLASRSAARFAMASIPRADLPGGAVTGGNRRGPGRQYPGAPG